MLREVQDALLTNKGGRGDGTGEFPPDALEHVCAYFMGANERLQVQRERMKVHFQARYGKGAGASAHDITWLFQAVSPLSVSLPPSLPSSLCLSF